MLNLFMIQEISLATAFIGTAISAVWDLKTTEVPDQIPYIMIAIAILLFSYQSFAEWSYKPILNCLTIGLAFLAFGFAMYFLGQWGGADALILAAIGFLLPTANIQTAFSFPIAFLFNLFLIGAVYMIIYAIVLAFMNRGIFTNFVKNLKASCKLITFGSIGLFIIFFAANYFVSKFIFYDLNYQALILNSLIPLFLTIVLFVIWKFARSVEEIGFKKKIPVSKLKVGDMLLKEKKLIGITEKQLKKIKKSGVRYIWIKEGVRFAPAFTLTLIFTFLVGDGILFFIKLLG
jgi:Flp pilus assembly protein protease CpaA